MPLRPVRVDLCVVAAEAIESVVGWRYDPVVDLRAPEPIELVADRDVVRRIIANLVANALKVTPKDGQVRVEIGAGPAGAEVRVVDTGPGIPAEYHDQIFERFVRVDGTGRPQVRSSGLGLAFCRLAVGAHGGRIGLTSEVGKGSTFWFVLPPLVPPPVDTSRQATETETIAPG